MSSRLSHATSPLAQVGDEKMPMTRASPVITSNQDRWPLATTTMAATTASRPKQSKSVSKDDAPKTLKDQAIKSSSELAIEHLPPLMLIFTVLFCSGAIFVLAMRDFMSTGRVIAGEWDDAFMTFTKSTQWFDDSNGWKSTQGGFSAVQRMTTDKNNMGGFFVRKVAGGAAMTVHLQKMLPLLVHPYGSQWMMGHFRPLLATALIANGMVILFYACFLDDLVASGAEKLPQSIMTLLTVESVVILYYLFQSRRHSKRGPAILLPEGKTHRSVVSRIVMKTVVIVSSLIGVIAGRDLFFPGYIFDYVPRDDIYLEWTNALVHSPPEGSVEAADHGLEAPLHIGDKFISQYMALHLLILCLYKFVSACLIPHGSDGGGWIKAKMIWKVQAIGDGLLLFVLRLFTPAAASASLDLRWHLMCVAYEGFILGLYAFT